ncbi:MULTISPECIES: hypothetical protein [unclassified Nocardiopsis]|uniref:hypothetical protein n=1 Tax=unclassified Nocardiopsis TaxID=2649073 RepID=UPI001300FEC5|nr:hypothetical protein [Nocardiopsis sp. TSRI0078]
MGLTEDHRHPGAGQLQKPSGAPVAEPRVNSRSTCPIRSARPRAVGAASHGTASGPR